MSAIPLHPSWCQQRVLRSWRPILCRCFGDPSKMFLVWLSLLQEVDALYFTLIALPSCTPITANLQHVSHSWAWLLSHQWLKCQQFPCIMVSTVCIFCTYRSWHSHPRGLWCFRPKQNTVVRLHKPLLILTPCPVLLALHIFSSPSVHIAHIALWA